MDCFFCIPSSFMSSAFSPEHVPTSSVHTQTTPPEFKKKITFSVTAATPRREGGRIRAQSSPAIIVPHDRQRVILENEMLAEDMRLEHYESKNLAMQRLIHCSDSNQRVSKTIKFSDCDENDKKPLTIMDTSSSSDDLFSMDDGIDDFNTSPSSVVYSSTK